MADTNEMRIAELRRAREKRPGQGGEYASAIGMIAAAMRLGTANPLRTVQQVREILAALDEVTHYQDD